jgi:hypothetical protein
MSDPADDLDAAIAQVVSNAGADAPAPPDVSIFTATATIEPPPGSTRTRWVTVAALGLAVAAATAVAAFVVIADRPNGTSPPAGSAPPDASPEPEPAPVQTAPPETTPPATTGPAPTGSTVPTTAAGTPSAGIIRPVVASGLCEPVVAREGVADGLALFARPSNNPIPIQIIGDPVDGPVGAFALVQRYFGDAYEIRAQETVDIDGVPVGVSVYDNGNGEVTWNLADGSQGYLRSRGLDREVLIEMVSALAPRPVSAPIPGFDYTTGGGDMTALELLHEQMSTEVTGRSAGSECQVAATGYRYWISAVVGDPVFQYGGVIDRPAPLEVGVRNGALVVIEGLADPTAPTVSDVINADPVAWLDLRSRLQPLAEGGPLVSIISPGVDVVVALAPVDEATAPTSYLTLRLATREGATFLEIHTADAVLAPDAAFWATEIDGRRSFTTAAPAMIGSVMGTRIGDATAINPFSVTISIIDGGDFVLQTTGPIQLTPLL